MSIDSNSLAFVFDGWDGYHTSLVHAIAPLSAEQLSFRDSPKVRSIGELARHIAMCRIGWFSRIHAPLSAELLEQVGPKATDPDGNVHVDERAIAIADNAAELVRWLDASWRMIGRTLADWQVADLAKSYRYTYRGTIYNVSRQWTTFRILLHDVHHGGQIARILAVQGIDALELRALGGHITEPPKADAPAT